MESERWSADLKSGGDREPSVNLTRRSRRALSLVSFFQLILSVFLIFMSSCEATIFVVSDGGSNETVMTIQDMPARFVPERYAYYGMQGYIVKADPITACTKVKPPPKPYNPNLEYPVSWILLAKRSPDCHFQTKIENAQISGYSAIIIHNVNSNDTEVMGVEDPGKLMIYATFIGEYDGERLMNYTFPEPYFLRIRNDFSVNGYLLPFAVIVGICIMVMLLFMVRLLWQQVARWWRERRRSRRRKLPPSALKKLPVHKWTKGDPYETCAVCLDDFVEQEKVRVLPCCHGYHVQCIDHWLTKGRRVCPICKRKVIVADEQISDSDTETEDENAPLIPTTSSSQSNPSSGASTFTQNQMIIAALERRRLITRRPHPPTAAPSDSSDASSISSTNAGEAQLQTDRLTQSTVSDTQVQVRTPGPSSSGRFSQSHSQSVFAEVHTSTEQLRRRLEAEYQKKRKEQIQSVTNADAAEPNSDPPLADFTSINNSDSPAETPDGETNSAYQVDNQSSPCPVARDGDVFVVIAEPDSNGETDLIEDEDKHSASV